MKKKLKFIIPVVVLLIAGAAYKLVLAPKPAAAKPPKIKGSLIQLSPEFVVNLAGDRYGKLTVSLEMPVPPVAAKDATGPVLPKENDAVRAVITDTLTGASPEALISPAGRHRFQARILKNLKHQTDEKVDEVLFTDIAVQ